MSKKQCPECGASNSALATRCSACDAYLSARKPVPPAAGTSAESARQHDAPASSPSPSPSPSPSRSPIPAPDAVPGLVACTDCGQQISPRAPSCPHCGAPKFASSPSSDGAASSTRHSRPVRSAKPKAAVSSSKMIVGGIIWVVVIVMVSALWNGDHSQPAKADVEQRVSAEPKPKRELTPAEQREKDIKRQFSPLDGSHRNLERLVKNALHDPDSYDHVETRYSDKGDHLMVSLKYRAVNGFGATRLHRAVAKVGLDGSIIQVIDNSPL